MQQVKYIVIKYFGKNDRPNRRGLTIGIFTQRKKSNTLLSQMFEKYF